MTWKNGSKPTADNPQPRGPGQNLDGQHCGPNSPVRSAGPGTGGNQEARPCGQPEDARAAPDGGVRKDSSSGESRGVISAKKLGLGKGEWKRYDSEPGEEQRPHSAFLEAFAELQVDESERWEQGPGVLAGQKGVPIDVQEPSGEASRPSEAHAPREYEQHEIREQGDELQAEPAEDATPGTRGEPPGGVSGKDRFQGLHAPDQAPGTWKSCTRGVCTFRPAPRSGDNRSSSSSGCSST